MVLKSKHFFHRRWQIVYYSPLGMIWPDKLDGMSIFGGSVSALMGLNSAINDHTLTHKHRMNVERQFIRTINFSLSNRNDY